MFTVFLPFMKTSETSYHSSLEADLYNPEVSVKRLSRVIQLLSEKEKCKPEDLKIEHTYLIQKILKDQNFWLTANQELELLSLLDQHYNIQEFVYNVGKEFFLTDCFSILPTDDSLLNYFQIMFRIPIILQNYVRYLSFEVTEKGQNYILIQLNSSHKENLYDLLFLKGLLESSAILYRIVGWKMELLETHFETFSCKLLFDDTQKIRFNTKNTIFKISWKSCELEIGKTNLKQKQSSFEAETLVISKMDSSDQDFGKITYINLDEIVQKSRELYLENRDLEAAVEVLSSFRNDLMSKQKAISKDLKMARNIQRGIIPQYIPDWKGLQFAFSFLPMQEVSGDYYDYFQFGSNKIGIMLSDVSGHGVPAAFITAISKLLFTNYKLDSPAEIFMNANRELIDLVKQQGYLTCFYGIIDSDYKMTYCIAGHPRPILLRYATGEIEILEGEGTFLGMFEDAHELYKDNSIQLEPGDKLFIYTDGLLEGQSDEGIPFQQENLIRCIKQTRDKNVKEAVNFVMKEFDAHCMGTDQSDDVTLLVVELSVHMKEFENLKKEAEFAFNQKDYNVACQKLLKAKEIFPNDTYVLFLLGRYFFKLKNYNEAIKYLEKYHSMKTLNADSHMLLGHCYYRIENYNKAEIELTKALSLRNNHPQALYSLAKVQYKKKNYEKSKSILEKLLELNPQNVKVQNSLTVINKILAKKKKS